MDYRALISKSKSVREYQNQKINSSALEKLKAYSAAAKRLLPDIEVEIHFLEKEQVYSRLDNIAGYHGHMLEAPCYLILLSEKKDHSVANSGALGQDLILKAEELDIDSCWITFSDSERVKERLGLDSSKEVTALIALGYGVKQPGKVINTLPVGTTYENADMKVVKEDGPNRLDIDEIVFLKEWGQKTSAHELEERGVLDAFHYASLAPSTLNRQPWRFILDDGMVVLALRKDEHAESYGQQIDAGIIMLYFEAYVSATLCELSWTFGKPEKDYKLPSDYEIISYCKF